MTRLEEMTRVELPALNPDTRQFVYVICYEDERGIEIPFYVGQTTRIWGRLDDYFWATFSASTDFRVGEAIRYLREKSYRVFVRYRAVADARAEELALIRHFGSMHGLLNDSRAYSYRVAIEDEVRAEVRRQVDEMVLNP